MTPEEHTTAINALQHDVSKINAVLNNGLRTMVLDQKSELAAVKADIHLIRDALTGHVAREGADLVTHVLEIAARREALAGTGDDNAADREIVLDPLTCRDEGVDEVNVGYRIAEVRLV